MNVFERTRFWWRAMRYRHKLDPGEIRAILDHVGAGQTVLDIGSHKGAYTYWLQKKVGREGRVFCFEPQRRLAEYLDAAVKSLGWPHVAVENMALSAEPGEAALDIPEGRQTSPGAGIDLEANGGTRVAVTTLTDYLGDKADHRPIRFIKCDVEGHELEVFRGGEAILREDGPILLFECEARHRQDGLDPVFDYLKGLGYEGRFFYGKITRPLAEFRVEHHQRPGRKPYLNNFLFMRP